MSTTTSFQQARTPTGARPLAGRYYTSDDVFRAEAEHIFSRRWICAGRAEHIAAPGDFAAVSIAGESLLLVRDREGGARAFYNVCRHRGTRLCDDAAGRFSGDIRCPYHAWAYALDGRLVAARHMDGTADFDRRDYPLFQAALAEWEGFLFINLAAEPEPFESAFAPLMGRFAAWDLPSLQSARFITYEVQANWKLIVENYSECYHCPLVHPELTRISHPDSGRNDLDEGPFLGGYMLMTGESMTLNGHTPRPPVGTVAGENLGRVYYYALFPNMLLSLHPDYVMSHILWPEAAGRTRILCEWHFDPRTIKTPGFDPEDAVSFWDLTNRQDWRICERGQLGVGSRAYVPGPYSQSEGLLWSFDREYLAAMGEVSEP